MQENKTMTLCLENVQTSSSLDAFKLACNDIMQQFSLNASLCKNYSFLLPGQGSFSKNKAFIYKFCDKCNHRLDRILVASEIVFIPVRYPPI